MGAASWTTHGVPWLGSQRLMYGASLLTTTFFDDGSLALMRLYSVPLRPLTPFFHPKKWSKDRFSCHRE